MNKLSENKEIKIKVIGVLLPVYLTLEFLFFFSFLCLLVKIILDGSAPPPFQRRCYVPDIPQWKLRIDRNYKMAIKRSNVLNLCHLTKTKVHFYYRHGVSNKP